MDLLERLGYKVIRSAASHGPIDIIAGIHDGDRRAIAVKYGKKPYIPPEERKRLKEWAEAFAAKAEVWFFKKGEAKPKIEYV
jgi:Holliday junction resolvase